MPRLRGRQSQAQKAAQRYLEGGGYDRQFYDEPCPPRLIILHADLPVVLQYDRVDDGQAKAHPIAVPRKIGIEDPALIFVPDPGTRIGNLDEGKPPVLFV